jgi:hypothetical protein
MTWRLATALSTSDLRDAVPSEGVVFVCLMLYASSVFVASATARPSIAPVQTHISTLAALFVLLYLFFDLPVLARWSPREYWQVRKR